MWFWENDNFKYKLSSFKTKLAFKFSNFKESLSKKEKIELPSKKKQVPVKDIKWDFESDETQTIIAEKKVMEKDIEEISEDEFLKEVKWDFAFKKDQTIIDHEKDTKEKPTKVKDTKEIVFSLMFRILLRLYI